MIRSIKGLGLALFAVMAMSAFIASAAQAESPGKIELGSGTEQAVEGNQIEGKHVFTVDGSTVECNIAVFKGTAVNNATNTIVHPEYKNCEALFGFVEGTVTTTNCNYNASAPTETVTGMTWTAQIKLECTGTSKIVIVAGTCEATVAPQTISTGLKFTNNTVSPMDVVLDTEGSEVKTVKVKDGALCPFKGTGETTATYSGKTTLTAAGGITVK